MARRHRFADFELEPEESRLWHQGEPIPVQPKVLDALRLFVERPGRLVSKQELLDTLWPGQIVGEESLTQVIHKLRLALGDDSQVPRFVETVPRRGYRFLPAVEVVEVVAAAPAATAHGHPPNGATAQRPAQRRWPAALLLALLGSSGLLLWQAGKGSRHRGVEGPPPQRRLTATPGRETYPALAPDGSRYAFALRPPGEPTYDLYVAPLGGSPVRLTATPAEELAPRFAPDGSELLFTRYAGGRRSLLRIPALGGAPRLLVEDGEEGAWTPDGRSVVYVRPEPGPLFVVRRRELASGREVELWRHPEPLASLAVSPDGERLAAVAGERRVLLGPARGVGRPRTLAGPLDYVRSLDWLPAGDALVTDGRWPGHRGNLMRLPIDGGPARPLTAGSSGLFHPSSDRHGRVLYALEHKVRQIVRLDASLRPVAALPAATTVECFDLAPRGDRLAVTDWDAPPGRGSLALVGIADGAVQPLGDGLCPAYAPDGRRLAFLGHTSATLGCGCSSSTVAGGVVWHPMAPSRA